MPLFTGFRIAASGMAAQRVRMEVVSSNLANAQTTRTAAGGPYQRQEPVFQAVPVVEDPSEDITVSLDPRGPEHALRAVDVPEVAADPTLGPLVWDPDHPDADADGNVRMPNVEVVEEVVDLITASRSFEANVQAFQTLRDMVDRSLEIGR